MTGATPYVLEIDSNTSASVLQVLVDKTCLVEQYTGRVEGTGVVTISMPVVNNLAGIQLSQVIVDRFGRVVGGTEATGNYVPDSATYSDAVFNILSGTLGTLEVTGEVVFQTPLPISSGGIGASVVGPKYVLIGDASLTTTPTWRRLVGSDLPIGSGLTTDLSGNIVSQGMVKNSSDDTLGYHEAKHSSANDVAFTNVERSGSHVLESTTYQLTGFPARLVPVTTDFAWAGVNVDPYTGGRGVSPGFIYKNAVETRVWAIQEGLGYIHYTVDEWKTSILDSSIRTVMGEDYSHYFPVIRYLYMNGIGKYAWVCGCENGLVYYAPHDPENYNADGTLKPSAWSTISVPHVVADIGVSGNVACMVGNHGFVTRTTDWLTFTDVYSNADVLGGIDTDRYGRWITIVRDTGRMIISNDEGATWTATDIYVDDVASGTLHPTGSITSGNGVWLALGAGNYSYSTDGLHWYTSVNDLGSFYGCGFDGARFYASNPEAQGETIRVYQLLINQVACHRHLLVEKGITVEGDAWFPDLIDAESLGTDHQGRLRKISLAGSKSRLIAKATPATGDNFPLLYAKTAATLVTARAVLSGPSGSSASFNVYYSTNRSIGASGTKITPTEVSLTNNSNGVLLTFSTNLIPEGAFVYVMVTTGALAQFLEFYISYTGGD